MDVIIKSRPSFRHRLACCLTACWPAASTHKLHSAWKNSSADVVKNWLSDPSSLLSFRTKTVER